MNWMVEQARLAGVAVKTIDPIPSFNVVIHEQSNVIQAGSPKIVVPREVQRGDLPWIDYVFPEDREVKGAVAGNRQRNMRFDNGSMTHADTYEFITWLPRDATQTGTDSALAPRTLGNITGEVNVPKYVLWLCKNNYFKEDSALCPDEAALP